MLKIYFDLGDVLVSRKISLIENDYKIFIRKYNINSEIVKNAVDYANLVFPEINSHKLFSVGFRSLEIEIVRTKTYYRLILERLGLNFADSEQILEERFSNSPYDLTYGCREFLEDFYKKGCKFGVMSNGRPSRRLILEEKEIAQYFDKTMIFVSDEVGYHKPQSEFWKFVSQSHEINSNSILVDDEKSNCFSFEACGGSSFLFDIKENNIFNNLKKYLYENFPVYT